MEADEAQAATPDESQAATPDESQAATPDESQAATPDEASPAPAQPKPSDKQLAFAQVLIRKAGLSEEALEALLQEVAGKRTLEDLSRREASEVIDELQIKARELGIDLDAQDPPSDKQLNFILSLKRQAHLTEQEFLALIQEVAAVASLEEVGRRDASRLIEALLKLKKGGPKGSPPGAPPPAGPSFADDPPEAYDDDVPF